MIGFYMNRTTEVTLLAPTPQNGQTHLKCLLSVFDHFVGFALEGLNYLTEVLVAFRVLTYLDFVLILHHCTLKTWLGGICFGRKTIL